MRQRLPLILSIVAVVIAVLGSTGVGEAAKRLVLPKNSVATPQLRNGAVTTPKLRNNAVTSVKVRNGSLFAADFAPGQIPPGPAGPPGEKGEKGDTGAAATALWASLNADGSVVSAKGVTTTSKTGTGSYVVNFNQDVSKCAILATQALISNAYASARPVFGSPNAVSVSIFATPLVGPPAFSDKSFSVGVFC